MNPTFFTDRDLGKRFAEILIAGGLSVERHVDHFEPACPDEEWLESVGTRGWLAITHDKRIRYKPNERDAVIRHKVGLLVVIGTVPYPILAEHFVATYPKIFAFLAEHKPPFIAKVYRPTPSELSANPKAPGSVSLWYPTE